MRIIRNLHARRYRMINFWKIDKFSPFYLLLYAYVRLAYRTLYYKQYRVLNEQNIHKRGEPLLIVCNHQNGLLDALAILFMFADWRQPVFIARGDLFRKAFVAKLLRFIKIMPAFRTMDGDDPSQNEHIFAVAVPNREALSQDYPGKITDAGRVTDAEDALINSLVKQEIETINRKLPGYKKIADFVIRYEEFEKNAQKKIRRFLYKKYENP